VATNPYNFAQQRQGLAAQLKQEADRQAMTAAQGSRQQLSDMMRQQQQQTQMSRQQVGEQGFMAQRAIEQGAASRGLGSSGLKDLSLIQSQMAQGQAVSDIEAQNRMMRTAGMREGREIETGLANALRQSDLTYAQQQIGEQERLQEQLMSLYQAGLAGASLDEIRNMAAISGVDISSLTPEQLGAIESTGSVDGLGGLDLGLGQSGISRLASSLSLTGAVVGAGRLFDKDFGYGFDTQPANPNYEPVGKTASYNYTIAGQKLGFTNANDVAYYLKNTVYKDKPYIQQMNLRVNTRTGKVEFMVLNKPYNTYNEAEAALRGQG
jgi:hypothetical protein